MPYFEQTPEQFKRHLEYSRRLVGLYHRRSDWMRGHWQIVTPENIISDQLSIACLIAMSFFEPDYFDRPMLIWGDEIAPKDRGHTAVVVASTIAQAIPYLWMDEMRVAAATQSALPTHYVKDLHPPHNNMWWRWERVLPIGKPVSATDALTLPEFAKGMKLVIDPDYDGVFVLGFILMVIQDWGLNLIEVGMDNTNQVPTVSLHLRILARGNLNYPDDFEPLGTSPRDVAFAAEKKTAYEFFAKLTGFINSPFITIHKTKLPRAAKRQLDRAKAPDITRHQEGVNLVTLRRELVKGGQVSQGFGKTLTERFLISGYYKNHWWPVEKVHKLTWIAPYIRGPEDGPLRERGYKVVR